MEYNAFTGGVRQGSVTASHEIIALICYVVKETDSAITRKQLQNALLEEELVNFFECNSALDHLIKSGHLLEADNGDYTLTELGVATVEEFKSQLPLVVKERALAAMKTEIEQTKLREENIVKIEKTLDGYQISLTVTDIGTDLMALKLFMPTKDSCEHIEARFLADPQFFYTKILAIATGDDKIS